MASIDSRDRALKGLRAEPSWTRLVTTSPLHAHLTKGSRLPACWPRAAS